MRFEEVVDSNSAQYEQSDVKAEQSFYI